MTTTHDAQRAMKIFFKSELDEHDRKEWFAITGQYDLTTKVLWDTIRASESVAGFSGLGAAVSASPQISRIEWQAILDAMMFTENNVGLVSDAHIRVRKTVERKITDIDMGWDKSVSASPQPSVDIKQKCINFICQNPYPAWDQLVELVESCFAAAPAQEPQESLVGKIVRVNNPRFSGYGFAQYDSGDRSRVIGVVLENGNTWEYAIETVRAALPKEISKAPKAVQARLNPAQEQPVENSPQEGK